MLAAFVRKFLAIGGVFIVAPVWNYDIAPFHKWVPVVKHSTYEQPDYHFNGDIKTELDRMRADYAERYSFIDDPYDHWQTRKEFRKNGGGDCEDFAIAWYYDLLELGLRDDEMYIALFKRPSGDVHAVLIIQDQWVLDQQREKVFPISSYDNYGILQYRINRKGWSR